MRKILITLLVLVNVSFANVITIEQAVSLGLENNSDIKKAKKNLEKSNYMYKEAFSNALPKVDGQIRYLRSLYTKSPSDNLDMSAVGATSMDTMPYTQYPPIPISRTDSSIIQLSNGLAGLNNGIAKMVNGLGSGLDALSPQFQPQDNDVEASLTITQPLYVGGKVGTALKIAKVYKEMSQNIYDDQKDSLTKEIKKSFYNVLILKQVVEVLDSSKSLAQKHLKTIESMYNNGLVSEYDLTRARVNVMTINPTLVEMQNNLNMAKSALKIMIGYNIAEDLDVSGSFEDVKVNLGGDFLKSAVEHNNQLKNIKYMEKILEYNVKIEKGGHFPTVVAIGAYNFISKNSDLSKTFDDTYAIHNISAGVQVNIPIYAGGGVTAKTNQAEMEFEKTAILYDKVSKLIQLQAQEAYKRILVSQEKLKLQEEALKEAKKGVEIATVRFENGLGTQIDLLDAQNNLRKIELNKLTAQKELIDAKLDFIYITKNIGE